MEGLVPTDAKGQKVVPLPPAVPNPHGVDDLELINGAQTNTDELHVLPDQDDGPDADVPRQQSAKRNTWLEEQQEKVNQEMQMQETHESNLQNLTWVQRLAFSAKFSAATTVLICINGLLIGIETDHGDGSLGWKIVETTFLACYTIELIIRYSAEGLRVFCKDGWIRFDTTVLAIAYIDMLIIDPLSSGGGGEAKQVAMVLRITRLLKLARIIRLLRFFKELWLLVASFGAAFKTLAWTFFLLVMVLYVFAILFVKLLGKESDDPEIDEWFGNLPGAMFTLFQIMTLEGWADICRVILATPQWFMVFVILIFIMICTFAIMNTVMAVIVQHTLNEAMDQREDMMKKAQEEFQRVAKDLVKIFHEADVDRSGMLSKEEFVNALANPKVRKVLQGLDLGTDISVLDSEEIGVLFSTIDVDGNNELHPEEFVDGMMRMRGEARARSIFELHCHVQKQHKVLFTTVGKIQSDQEKLTEKVGSLESALCAQTESMEKLVRSMKAISTALGVESGGSSLSK